MSRFRTKLFASLLVWVLTILPFGVCLAQEQTATQASFAGALIALTILLVLVVGIVFALKIHSLLKGGELSSVWVFSSLALSVLLVSAFLEFLHALGAFEGLFTFIFLVQLLGFFLLLFGLILLKKKLS